MKIHRQLSLILILLMVSMGIPGFSYAGSEEIEPSENGIVSTVDDVTDLVLPEDEHGTLDSGSDPGNDELLMQYIDRNVDTATGQGTSLRKRAAASNRRSKLSDYDKAIYDAVQVEVDKIAAGERADSMLEVQMKDLLQGYLSSVNAGGYVWKITSESLGLDTIYEYKTYEDGHTGYGLSDEAHTKLCNVSLIISALSADMPQSLYWFDKTKDKTTNTSGLSYGLNAYIADGGKTVYFKEDPCLSIKLMVSSDYSKDGKRGTYELDTSKTAAAAACVTTVSDIINENSEKADYDKLLAYMNRICILTEYNHSAAGRSADYYGDPWQMIYVFDGDPDTKVVCEGYAKAFQYLCDKSSFADDSIECHTVSGNTSGPHMWNVIRMDDGRYYIADITYCDAGSTGDPRYLFLTGCETGDMYSGYTYKRNSITYKYDQGTLNLYTDEELSNPSIGYLDYKTIDNWEAPEYEWAKDLSTVTATRIGTSGTDPDKQYIDKEVRHTVTKVITPAQCTTEGMGEYVARFYYAGFEEQEETVVIPEAGHLWNGGVETIPAKEGVEGVRTFTCGRCALTHTEIIPAITYTADLPAVKISKPKAGKKKMTVKWKKVSKKNQKKITGIEIQIATDPAFTSIVMTTTGGKNKTSKTIKGLRSNTKYYVRIRAFKNAADGKHISKWKKKDKPAKVK